jgi:Glyoxalase-like domain
MRLPPYDEAELQRLRSVGIHDPEDDPTVCIQAPGGQPNVFLQRVPEPKSVKNRLHLDLRCESFETEKARLTGLGAVVVGQFETFVVLSDPEGNEFCLSRRTGQ